MSDESRGDATSNLNRTLGLVPTFMIGAGTMVGAGIFVFPGLAGGRTGAGAAVSFAIGGAIALLVGLVTSELATRTPSSGGVVNFARDAFGRHAGALLGLAQWMGLVFSVGFYLLGFGEYARSLSDALGLELPAFATPLLAAGGGVVLGAIALVDTEASGRVQKVLVSVLLVGLIAFVAYCIYAPVSGASPARPLALAPRGPMPILSTAALVFTSYLGFVQIANVAGDVQKPTRTIPLAILGSITVVAVLYVSTMIGAAAAFAPAELAELGETALAELAEVRLGRPARLAVLGAGVLATLSSANASILSTSRTLFALGRDGVVPQALARVSERFGTPQLAVLASATPALALLAIGHLELLAQVASLLHLIIYAAICFALLRSRSEDTNGFRAPFHPVTPIVGGAACLSLCGFFSTDTLWTSAAAVVVIAIYWVGYDRLVDEVRG